jgi:hypothetical protein
VQSSRGASWQGTGGDNGDVGVSWMWPAWSPRLSVWQSQLRWLQHPATRTIRHERLREDQRLTVNKRACNVSPSAWAIEHICFQLLNWARLAAYFESGLEFSKCKGGRSPVWSSGSSAHAAPCRKILNGEPEPTSAAQAYIIGVRDQPRSPDIAQTKREEQTAHMRCKNHLFH